MPASSEQRRRRALVRKTEKEGECVVWTGYVGNHGYGTYRTATHNLLIHRVAWELEHGALPDGHHLHHTCGNGRCVNLLHLQLLTSSEHWKIGNSPSAQRARAVACKRGHAFTETNTYVNQKGHRRCRRCHADREMARR